MKTITWKKWSLISGIIITLPRIVFGASGNEPDPISGIKNPLNTGNDIEKFITAVLKNVVLPIGAVICALGIMYAGYLLVTARGDVKKLTDGKRALLYSVIGTAILLGAIGISEAVRSTVDQITN